MLDNIILADVMTHLLNRAQCAPRSRDIIILHMAYTADHTYRIPFLWQIRSYTRNDNARFASVPGVVEKAK